MMDNTTSPEELVDRAATIAKLAMERGLAEKWMVPVPSHANIMRAMETSEKIMGTHAVLDNEEITQ